ncbi:MAG TPA: lipopolysaccharide kinase InaA family protein [Gemmataceae bacterium]|nr:lipopolysaccharide kinase InaA family protein [Gemmataceae bacterium]
MNRELPGFEEVVVGDMRWQVVPDVREQLLGSEGILLDHWLAHGQARVVKHGPHRSVYAVALPGLSVHVKYNRLSSARAWLRELARASKARSECRQALGVTARHVPTVTPVAVGECVRGPGKRESFLITRSLEASTPLDVFVLRDIPALSPGHQVGIRQRLAVSLGEFLARMHEAGIVHRDLHAGNVMVGRSEAGEPRLHLLDLHSVRLGRVLDWPASRDNLVVFNRWFQLHVGRSDRLRCWQAYFRARFESCAWPAPAGLDLLDKCGALARELEARTRESNARFWLQRDRRCLATNRYYRRVRGRGVVGHVMRDLDPAVAASLLADPDEPFRRTGVKFLKDSRTSTVVEFELLVGSELRRVIYKRFQIKSQTGPWLSLMRRPPALRSWVAGHGLRERCLPTARPLAVLHRRRGGLLHQGYLLSLKIPDAVELPRFLDDLLSMSAARRSAILRDRIEQIARLVREMHGRGVSHRDLKGANILTTDIRTVVRVESSRATMPTMGLEDSTRLSKIVAVHPILPLLPLSSSMPDVRVIDLVGVTLTRQVRRARRVQNLARLNASVGRHLALTRTDLLRFLRVYLQWGLRGRSNWKTWWRGIAAATRAKQERNARNGRPLH